MVATHALSRGIDDKGIKEVEILGTPPTFEDWVQIAGRVRGEGLVHTIWDANDTTMWLRDPLECTANPTLLPSAAIFLHFLDNDATCRRVQLLQLLSSDTNGMMRDCGMCDACHVNAGESRRWGRLNSYVSVPHIPATG